MLASIYEVDNILGKLKEFCNKKKENENIIASPANGDYL